MDSRADVKRQDRIDAAARPNRSMERLAAQLEKQAGQQRLRRIVIFLFVLIWLTLLFGRSLVRQGEILDQVYANAAKERRIRELKMSNSQLREEIYRRTDLKAIEAAAIRMGMIPARQAPRILIPQVKNDEVVLRLESADAELLVSRPDSRVEEAYYNLEDYFERHHLAEVYFGDELRTEEPKSTDNLQSTTEAETTGGAADPSTSDETTSPSASFPDAAAAVPDSDEPSAVEPPPTSDTAIDEVANE